MSTEVSAFEAIYGTALLAAGFICFIHFVFFLAKPKRIDPERSVPGWRLEFSDFFTGVFVVIVAVVGVQLLVAFLAPAEWMEPDTPSHLLTFGLATHLAALGALFTLYKVYPAHFHQQFNRKNMPWGSAVVIAFYTFLVLVPVLYPLTLGWSLLLEAFGREPQPQDTVMVFGQIENMAMLVLMIFLTVIVAPVSEEILFRGCLYRFVKSKTSIIVALIATNILFALLHANLLSFLPLFLLGVILAYIYEKTGDLKVPILLHAIFNLNTVIVILLTNHFA